MASRLLVFFTLFTTAIFAQPAASSFERLLLPVNVTNAAGAAGSIWSVYGKVYIDSDTAPAFGPIAGCVFPDNPNPPEQLPSCDLGNSPLVRGLYPIGFYPTLSGETPGSYIYADRNGVDKLHLSFYLQNGSGPSIQLPIVREREFSNDTVRILDVPDSVTHRVMLRVYGSTPDTLGDVRVRIIREMYPDPPLVLRDEVLQLTVVQRYLGSLPVRPPYAELSLAAPITEENDTVRFEVTPLKSSLFIWALVSATDNHTQQVILRTPS
jgi:hypothetical protein